MLAVLEEARGRFVRLAADWVRVGYCQVCVCVCVCVSVRVRVCV